MTCSGTGRTSPRNVPAGGTELTLSDAELLTMAVMSALLGFTSERRWLRYVSGNLAGMFPRRIGQSGYNKRMQEGVLPAHPGDPDAGHGHHAVER